MADENKETETTTTPPSAPASPPPARPEPKGISESGVETIVQRMMGKAGNDIAKALRYTVKVGYKTKEELDAANVQVSALSADLDRARADLKKAQKEAAGAVPEGHVVVPKADAELLARYKALGTPEEVTDRTGRLETAEKTAAKAAREKALATVCEVSHYNPKILADLATDDMQFVPAKVRVRGGREVDSFQVKDKGPDGKERVRDLATVEQEEWAEYLPVLKAAPAAAPRRELPVGGPGLRSNDGYTPAPDQQAEIRTGRVARTQTRLNQDTLGQVLVI